MHHSLLHPCANEGGNCCGNAAYTPFLLRYESFFHSRNALLVLAYEACPAPAAAVTAATQARQWTLHQALQHMLGYYGCLRAIPPWLG